MKLTDLGYFPLLVGRVGHHPDLGHAHVASDPKGYYKSDHNQECQKNTVLKRLFHLFPQNSTGSIIKYSTVQYGTVQYSTAHCSTVQFTVVKYTVVKYTVIHYTEVQYIEVQYTKVQYCTLKYSTVQ